MRLTPDTPGARDIDIYLDGRLLTMVEVADNGAGYVIRFATDLFTQAPIPDGNGGLKREFLQGRVEFVDRKTRQPVTVLPEVTTIVERIESFPAGSLVWIRMREPIDFAERLRLFLQLKEQATRIVVLFSGPELEIEQLPTLNEPALFDLVQKMRRAPSAQDAIDLLRRSVLPLKRIYGS